MVKLKYKSSGNNGISHHRGTESTEGFFFFAHRETRPPRLARMAGVATMGKRNQASLAR
jgi:hypothetical protein